MWLCWKFDFYTSFFGPVSSQFHQISSSLMILFLRFTVLLLKPSRSSKKWLAVMEQTTALNALACHFLCKRLMLAVERSQTLSLAKSSWISQLLSLFISCNKFQGWGKTVVLGVDKPGSQLTLSSREVLHSGKSLMGSLFGGLKPKSDLPILLKRYMDKVGYHDYVLLVTFSIALS